MQVENKLDAMTFRDKDSCLRYVHNLTGGKVWIALKTRVPSKLKKEAIKPFPSVASMMKFLRINYGITNEDGKAHNSFFTLKQQDNERFSTFYTKYQTDRAHIDMKEKTEIPLFIAKLNEAYADKFITGDVPKKLRKIVKKCQVLEQQFDQHKETHKKPATRTPNAANPKNSTAAAAGASAGAAAGAAAAADSKKPFDSRPGKYKDLPALTKDHRVALMKDGKCLKCQEKGHMKNSTDCPLKDYAMPKAASAAASTITEAETENAQSTT